MHNKYNTYVAEQRSRQTWKGNRVMHYRFAEKLMQSRISEAFLHVHLKTNDVLNNRTMDEDEVLPLQVQVVRVWRAPGATVGWLASLASSAGVGVTRAQLAKGRWLQLDISSSLGDWMRLPRTELALAVRVHDKKRRYAVPPDDNYTTMPFLELYVDDEYKSRSKRTSGLICQDDTQEKRCCRYPLTVDFEEFGWDWIIAPKKYEANFCMGECPYAFMQRYPNTHVVHLASPPGYRGPCCTPRKVGPIDLLHFDHDFNIILGKLPSMVVEKCGCT